MARPIRIEVPWAYYHVTSRGVAQQDIFFSQVDRRAFLAILAQAYARWGLVFHGYCLMGNHYHLEIQSPEGHVSRPLQWINQKYAAHVNRTHRRVGHLFQGRFKAALVESGGHLRELTRYIHLNPVRAGVVARPGDYAWSSYRAYLGLRGCPEWLRTETTLARFGKSVSEQRRAYRAFVEEEVTVRNPLEDLRFGLVLGSEQFLEWAQGKLRGEECPAQAAEISEFRRARAPADLERVCEVLIRSAGVDERRLIAKGRWKNDDRDLAIYLAVRHTGARLSAIGERFGGLGASAVSHARKRLEHRMARDKALERRVRALSKEIGGVADKV